MTVTCRYCSQSLTLNGDFFEQLYDHIARNHMLQIVERSRKMHRLADMLFFTSDDPEWRKEIDDMVTYLLTDELAGEHGPAATITAHPNSTELGRTGRTNL